MHVVYVKDLGAVSVEIRFRIIRTNERHFLFKFI